MIEPEKIISGDAVSWERDVDIDLAAASFEYRFVGPSSFNLSAGYAAGAVSISQTSVDTAAFVAGEYEWFLFAAIGGERQLVCRGRMVIQPNPESAGDTNHQSHAEKMLAAIEARLEGRIISDHQSYTIGGRSLDRIPFEELHKLRNKYAWAARDNKVARGLVKPHRSVKFN